MNVQNKMGTLNQKHFDVASINNYKNIYLLKQFWKRKSWSF